jgi:type II secretory pathway predicted ATPase ExeA
MATTTRHPPGEAARAFRPTADPGALWLVGQYEDALETLRTAVLGRQGLLLLVGEPGTGKTVLTHALAARLRDDPVLVGRLLYPVLEGLDFLQAIGEAIGLPAAALESAEQFHEELSRAVADARAGGRRLLLVIDEAQSITPDLLLEMARLPYRADGDKDGDAAMSVLLVGQRELLQALRGSGIEPDVLCSLRPLTREQTAQYLAHRLATAGIDTQLFTPSALRRIWVVSEGIPRVINTLCHGALVALGRSGARKVTAASIDRSTPEQAPAPVPARAEAAAFVPARPTRPEAWRQRVKRRRIAGAPLAAAVLVVAIAGAAWSVSREGVPGWSQASRILGALRARVTPAATVPAASSAEPATPAIAAPPSTPEAGAADTAAAAPAAKSPEPRAAGPAVKPPAASSPPKAASSPPAAKPAPARARERSDDAAATARPTATPSRVTTESAPSPRPVVAAPPPAPQPAGAAPQPPAPKPVVAAPRPPAPKPVVTAPQPPAPKPVVTAPQPPAPKPAVAAPRPPAPKPVVTAPQPPAPKPVVTAPQPPAPRPAVAAPPAPARDAHAGDTGQPTRATRPPSAASPRTPADGADPGAIIDWLLRERASR